MTLNISVQIDSKINFSRDTTFLLMQEAQNRKYNIFHYLTENLVLKNNEPYALMKKVHINKNSFAFEDASLTALDDMDIILMRQNPPYDMRYMTTTYILEKCKRALVLNSPTGVRNSPEKMSVHFTLPTVVTENLDVINDFYQEHQEIILKPLYAYGGQNISYIRGGGNNASIIANMLKETYNCPVMAQKFHPSISDGDKRVMILGGEILGVFSRIPHLGDFRTNLCLGNKYVAISLSEEEEKLCIDIGKKLVKNGIIFAGIDLISGHVIEINVTSPTGLREINDLYNKNVEQDCWDYFESML